MLEKPASFGQTSRKLNPVPGLTEGDRRVVGAQLQHFVMNLLFDELAYQEAGVKRFAQECGMTADRLYRLRRGSQMLQLSDLVVMANRNPRLAQAVANFFTRLLPRDETVERPARS